MQYSNSNSFFYVGHTKRNEWQLKVAEAQSQLSENDQLLELFTGDIKDIKIEFNGVFVRDYSKDHFELKTEELPWVFVLLNDGRLYAKKALADMNTVLLISEHVTAMYPCRSWVSEDKSIDQGFLLGYIKDGIAYYANYHSISGIDVWETDIRVDDTDSASDKLGIQIFRLNDFRTCFYIWSATSRKLYVSNRVTIGGTFQTQFFHEEAKSPEFIMLNPARVSDPNPEALNPVISLENQEGISRIRIHIDYRFVYWDSRFPTFNSPSIGNIVSGEIEESTGDILLTLDKYIESSHPRIQFSSLAFNRLRYQVTDYCKPILPETTFTTRPWEEDLGTIGNFSLDVSNIQVQFNAVRKENHTYLFREGFSTQVNVYRIESGVYRKEEKAQKETDHFENNISNIRVSFGWAFSGEIIT